MQATTSSLGTSDDSSAIPSQLPGKRGSCDAASNSKLLHLESLLEATVDVRAALCAAERKWLEHCQSMVMHTGIPAATSAQHPAAAAAVQDVPDASAVGTSCMHNSRQMRVSSTEDRLKGRLPLKAATRLLAGQPSQCPPQSQSTPSSVQGAVPAQVATEDVCVGGVAVGRVATGDVCVSGLAPGRVATRDACVGGVARSRRLAHRVRQGSLAAAPADGASVAGLAIGHGILWQGLPAAAREAHPMVRQPPPVRSSPSASMFDCVQQKVNEGRCGSGTRAPRPPSLLHQMQHPEQTAEAVGRGVSPPRTPRDEAEGAPLTLITAIVSQLAAIASQVRGSASQGQKTAN
jgi:hypothetical protein